MFIWWKPIWQWLRNSFQGKENYSRNAINYWSSRLINKVINLQFTSMRKARVESMVQDSSLFSSLHIGCKNMEKDRPDTKPGAVTTIKFHSCWFVVVLVVFAQISTANPEVQARLFCLHDMHETSECLCPSPYNRLTQQYLLVPTALSITVLCWIC